MTSKLQGAARKPPNAGKGRKVGVPNKFTADLKAMILQALERSGGADYLQERANDPKTAAAFLGLVGKVLPLTLAGDGSNVPVFKVIQVSSEEERAQAWKPPQSTS